MKKFSILLLVVVGVFSISSSAFAAKIERTSAGKGFSKAWESSVNGGSGDNTYTMIYGFNKYAIDEDYCHTYHNSLGHTAILTNATNTFSNSDKAGKWARVDVIHSGNSVTYKMEY